MTLVVGVLISMAWQNEAERLRSLNRLSPDIRDRLSYTQYDVAGELDKTRLEAAKSREEVEKLRKENEKLTTQLAQGTGNKQLFSAMLADTKVFACLTEARGPGLVVTLSDSRKDISQFPDTHALAIHDLDVLRTVNELWNAGAEGISVNNLRVGPGSNFRCVGTTILVDSQKISTPVVIRAIGDPKLMYGAMNLPDGELDEVRSTDPNMVKVEIAKKLHMPAFSGSTARKFLEVPKESETQKEATDQEDGKGN
jgi:uncharacterized protein YlxW (UPF0749 family)